MRLPFVTASLFIAGTLLTLNPAAPIDQALSKDAYMTPEFSLGQLTLNEQNNEEVVETTEKKREEPKEVVEKKPEKVIVTVNKGDTLTKIAKAHNTTYKRLFDANKNISNPDLLNVGDKIRIPEASEKIASREVPKPVVKQTSRATSNSSPLVASTAPAVASGSVWDRLAACESGGNWQINTGNGYYGGLQFLPSTWRAVGGSGLPHQHSREEQIKRAEILLARSGWGQWPACTAKLGLR